jgi:thiamine biosynthesis lipoprotein
MLRREFRAMGTDVELLLNPAVDADEAEQALDAAAREIAAIEKLASRFDRESELSHLNAAGTLEVSPDLMRLVTLALQMRDATAGRFDPTLHAAIVAAGYDRTLDDIPADGPAAGVPQPGGGDVDANPQTGVITLGMGVALDLGGIAKGWAADRAADLLGMAGSCLVSMGGDIAVRGSLDGEPWPIEVQHGEGTAVIGLTRGGMATSGTDRRRWRRDGKDMHHVIDPATGRPSDTDLVRVTAVAEDAAHAEVWATALLVSGSGAAADEADRMGMPAVLVAADGNTTSAGGLA